jgi:hypothetical protein
MGGSTLGGAARLTASCAAVLVALLLPATASAEGLIQVLTNGNGVGKVVGDSKALAPIDCPSACESLSGVSRVLTLTAVPAGDSSLAAWQVQPREAVVSGCGASTPCTVSVGSAPDSFENGFPVPHTAVVKVTATFVRNPDGVFLCYSSFQVDPGVWPSPEAATLFALGYWQPYAVLGARSATRLGAYSLLCNLPAAATVSRAEAVDGSGGLIMGSARPPLGLYPLARL